MLPCWNMLTSVKWSLQSSVVTIHEHASGLCLEEKETVLGGSVKNNVYRVCVYTYVCIYA